MHVVVKLVLIIVILGVVITGVTFSVLCMMKDDKESSYVPQVRYPQIVHSDEHEEDKIHDNDKPLLVSKSPRLGPISGKTQQPICGEIWNNIDVNYNLEINPSLGPVNPECRTL